MNVFLTAMSLIASIRPSEPVTIIQRYSVFDEATGVYNEMSEETPAAAHIQQEGSHVEDAGDTATDSTQKYQLWFIDVTPEIVNALKSTAQLNTNVLLSDGKVLTIKAKEDYSYNGWIYCEATLNAIR